MTEMMQPAKNHNARPHNAEGSSVVANVSCQFRRLCLVRSLRPPLSTPAMFPTAVAGTTRMNREALCQSVFRAASLLPGEERAAFDEAKEKALKLLMEESDPMSFIRFAEGDPEAAAKRLVAYWQIRKNTFGDRFLLPMDLSGRGALTNDDVDTLKTGFIALLPDDCYGRKVIYFDNSMSNKLLDGTSRRAARFRCLFYMSSVAAKEGKPCTLIRFSNTTKMYLHKAELVLGLFNSLPVKLSVFLNLYQAPPGARRMFEKTVVSIFEDFKDREKYRGILKSFIGDTPGELIEELSRYGFLEDCLPPSSGGTWDPAGHESWLLSRVREDRARYGTADVSDDEMKPPAGSNKRKAAVEENLDDLMVMKARAERKRLMDRKYSEQRRQKEKMEESTLYNQYVRLNAKNKELCAEEARLKKLLSQAQSKVTEIEAAATRAPRQEPVRVPHSMTQLGLSGSVASSPSSSLAQLYQQRQLFQSLVASSVPTNAPSLQWGGQAVDPSATLTLLQRMQPSFSTPIATQRPVGAVYSQHPPLPMFREFLSKGHVQSGGS